MESNRNYLEGRQDVVGDRARAEMPGIFVLPGRPFRRIGPDKQEVRLGARGGIAAELAERFALLVEQWQKAFGRSVFFVKEGIVHRVEHVAEHREVGKRG